MKRIIVTLFFLFSAFISYPQLKAVTDSGDEVVLYADGTWKYVKGEERGTDHIDTSSINYTKDENADFLVKSIKTGSGVYINPKKWKFNKEGPSGSAEYEFTLKEKDVYGLLLAEKIEIPFTTVKEAALANAKEAAPDIKVIRQEFRKVNGTLVLMLQMSGTIKGISFTYLGYYYTSSSGTVQLLTYTSANLFEEYHKDMETFLNGFVRKGQQD